MSEKPEALRLAEALEGDYSITYQPYAAAELRRQHAENEMLREEVRNWKKSFVGHVYVKNEDYAELIGERDALKTENERLREALTYDWDQLEACRESLREHMVEIKRLRGLLTEAREDVERLRRRPAAGGCMSVNEPLQPNYNFAWVKADNTRLTKEELHNQRRQDMSEKPKALADRLDDERMNLIERLADENERLRDELRQSSIDITRAEVERLKAENERLRDGLACDWAELKACRASLREHLLKIERLREALQDIARQPEGDEDSAQAVAKAALRREGT